jgi:hypothetical protein
MKDSSYESSFIDSNENSADKKSKKMQTLTKELGLENNAAILEQ